MNRWLLIGSLAGLLVASTGCLHHHTRGGCSSGSCGKGCSSGACGTTGGHCNSGACSNGGHAGAGGCQDGACGGACGNCGAIGKISGMSGLDCGNCGCRTGCQAGPLGWQQGGLNYSAYLQPGLCGHTAAQQLQNRPFTPGPPTGQVGYPYYTVRGPRDFLLDNPPTIGR